MTEKKTPSVLADTSIDKLLVLIEEVMRASPEGVKRFIEPAPGVLARAKASQHHLVFGRRGSGKSSLLRKTAADLTIDRRPIAFVDMETFKTHTYPDVLISVLIKSLSEFDRWLAEAATASPKKTKFWARIMGALPTRPPFKRADVGVLRERLRILIDGLQQQLLRPESTEVAEKHSVSSEHSSELELGGTLSAPHIDVKGGTRKKSQQAASLETQQKYVSHKIEYLHQHMMEFQHFFQQLAKVSDGPAFLILDDLYHIRLPDQPQVLDYFHRVAKGNALWLKIGTIRHRSEWYMHGSPPTGIKLGDDANEINLDVTLEKYQTCKTFLVQVLEPLVTETTRFRMRDLLNEGAIDRLVVACGGVARDFLGLFSNSIRFARDRDLSKPPGSRVSVEDVNKASGEYDANKREEFKLDTADDREVLLQEFEAIVDFCTRHSKCNIFLVPQAGAGLRKDALSQLIDLRLVHLVKSRVSVKRDRPGETYEAYMLDLSQYVGARKIHDFHLIDLSSSESAEQIRRASLVLQT